jgi:hypothetical protein
MIARVLQWIDCHSAGIQAISAVVVALLTGFLVVFTSRYVKRTGESIELSKQQLGEQKQALTLAKQEFEREWQPQLRIFVHYVFPNVILDLVNLGRTAIHVESVDFSVGVGTDLRSENMKLVKLIPVNHSEKQNIELRLLGVISKPTTYDGNMAVRAAYFSAGRSYQSDWFNFGVVVREGRIVKVDPMLGNG